jgi:4-amino-4-deoxy-L-arabinose transferase-like glycosyltransferase
MAHDVELAPEDGMDEVERLKWFGVRVRSWLAAMFMVALGLRLGIAFMLGVNSAPISDGSEYDAYAWNVAQGNGYRGPSPGVTNPNHLTAYRLPGTSMLWAAIYRAFGHRVSMVRITHCILGAIPVFFIYGLGKYCFDERVGLVSAAAYVIWPTSLFYSTELTSEPLFTFLLLSYLLLSIQVGRDPTIGRATAAGFLLGLATLTRGNSVLMIPLAAFWTYCQFRGRPRNLVIGLIIPLTAAATLIPWTMRNYVVFQEFLPLGTISGDVILGSNNRVVASNPEYYGYWVSPSSLPEYSEQLKGSNNEVLRDRLEKNLAAGWLEEHPNKWWYLIQAKFRRSLTPFLDPHSPRIYRLGTLLFWGPVLVLSALSMVPVAIRFFRSKHPGWLLHLALVDFELTAIMFWGASRFRYPVEPIFLILASATVFSLWERWRAGDTRSRKAEVA